MFGQLSLEGLSDFEPTKKSNNKEAKQQKPAAQKAAAKKATKPHPTHRDGAARLCSSLYGSRFGGYFLCSF